MRVIFLDFDGVVNGINFMMQEDKRRNFYAVNPVSVDIVKRIAEENKAIVVASTSLRFGHYFPHFTRPFEEKGVWIDLKTPDYNGDRAREIKEFVDKNKVTEFIILDDEVFDNYLPQFEKHLILTNEFIGLEEKHVGIAAEMFRKQGGKT